MVVLHPGEALHDRAMIDLDALGDSGGSRGEDDIGGQAGRSPPVAVYRGGRAGTSSVPTPGAGRIGPGVDAQVGNELRVDDHGRADRGGDGASAFLRFGRVDGHVGRTQPDGRVDGTHLLDRPVQRHDDPVAAPHAQTREPVCECPAGTLELAIGQGGVTERHRGCVGCRVDLAIEGGQDVLVADGDGRPAGTEAVHRCRLPGHQELEVCDGPTRLGDELREQAQQSPPVHVEFGLLVQRGVGVQTHFERGVRAGREDVHHEVFHHAGGQHVIAHASTVDDDRLVEQQQVDQRPEARTEGVTETGCRPDVLGAIALMAETRGDLRGHGRDDIGTRRRGDPVHAQGQHVGDHPGRVSDTRRRPRGHREAEDDVVASGHAREEGGERGSEDRGHRGVEVAGTSSQCVVELGTDQAGGDDRLVADPGGCAMGRQADPLGESGGALGPEFPVLLESRALPVRGIVGDHLGDAGAPHRTVTGPRWCRLGGVGLGAGLAVRVVPRHGLVQAHQRAVPVEGDVVPAHVPVGAIVGDPDERGDGHRVGEQVDGSLMVRTHPDLGCRFGIRLGPQVDVDDVEGNGVVDVLLWRAVDLGHAGVCSLEVARRVENAATEQFAIERAPVVDDVEVVRDRDRVVVDEILGEPHGALRRGQIQQLGPSLQLNVSRRSGCPRAPVSPSPISVGRSVIHASSDVGFGDWVARR